MGNIHEYIVGDASRDFHGWYYITVAYGLAIFLQSVSLIVTLVKDDIRVLDLSSGPTMATVALFTIIARNLYLPRHIVCTSLTLLWSLRVWRLVYNMKVSPRADVSNQEIENNVPVLRDRKLSGKDILRIAFSRTVFVTISILPIVWVNVLDSAHNGSRFPHESHDWFAFFLCISALLWTVLADTVRQRAAHDITEPNYHRVARKLKTRIFQLYTDFTVATSGPWAFSRHADAFGTAVYQIGIYMLVCRHTPFFTALPMLLSTFGFLLLPGGFSMIEAQRMELLWDCPWYLQYKDSTSPFWPVSPYFYKKVPNNIKRILCYDY